MVKARLKLVTPATVKRTIAPKRPPNDEPLDLGLGQTLPGAPWRRPKATATATVTPGWPWSPIGTAYERPNWWTCALGSGLQNGHPARP